MLAQKNDAFEETCETVYKLNQDENVRYLCEMREEGHRVLRTYESLLKNRDAVLAENAATLAEKDAKLAEQKAELSEKDAKLAEQEAALAESVAIIAELQAKLKTHQID